MIVVLVVVHDRRIEWATGTLGGILRYSEGR